MAKIKPSKGAPYARILGVGGYRPTRVVPNEVILETIDSSDEWIRSRSGIETRHWANDEETVAAMSIEASGKAIADAGIDASRIGAVVVSTVSHFTRGTFLTTSSWVDPMPTPFAVRSPSPVVCTEVTSLRPWKNTPMPPANVNRSHGPKSLRPVVVLVGLPSAVRTCAGLAPSRAPPIPRSTWMRAIASGATAKKVSPTNKLKRRICATYSGTRREAASVA